MRGVKKFQCLKCLQFFAVRSTESLEVRYGVVVPLLHIWGEECVSKEFPVFIVAGGAVTGFPRGGRSTRKESKYQSWNFDSTRGYPGEDISHFATLTCFVCSSEPQTVHNLPYRLQFVFPSLFLFVLFPNSDTHSPPSANFTNLH